MPKSKKLRQRMQDKVIAQREHCKKRFLERFGIDFNKEVRHYFLNEIQNKHSTCVEI